MAACILFCADRIAEFAVGNVSPNLAPAVINLSVSVTVDKIAVSFALIVASSVVTGVFSAIVINCAFVTLTVFCGKVGAIISSAVFVSVGASSLVTTGAVIVAVVALPESIAGVGAVNIATFIDGCASRFNCAVNAVEKPSSTGAPVTVGDTVIELSMAGVKLVVSSVVAGEAVAVIIKVTFVLCYSARLNGASVNGFLAPQTGSVFIHFRLFTLIFLFLFDF